MSDSKRQLTRISRRFKELRLLIANSIVLNNQNTIVPAEDIDGTSHTKELLDEYSIRYLLFWMVTRYGFDLYTKNIGNTFQASISFSIDSLLTTGWYPFQTQIDLSNESELIESVINFLNESDSPILPEPRFIGLFYEHLSSYSLSFGVGEPTDIQISTNSKYNRKAKGQFYTPPDIVSYCIREGIDKPSADLIMQFVTATSISRENDINIDCPYRVLDPACGTGNFLVGILEFFESCNPNRAQELIHSLSLHSLYGIDIDGRAVSLARVSVLFKVLEVLNKSNSKMIDAIQFSLLELIECLSKNIICLDSTLSALNTENPCSIFNWKEKSTTGFDLVITNPPYVSFGARNQQAIVETTANLYRQFYPGSSEYKIRLNSIFHDIALRYARDGGNVVLLVPDSFLTGRRYARLREGILEKTKILSLTEFPEDIIAGATVGRWCVAAFQKDNRYKEDYLVKTVSFCQVKNNTTNDQSIEYQIQLKRMISDDHKRFQLIYNSFDDDLCKRLKALPKIKNVLRGHTGIRSRIGQKNIVFQKSKTDLHKKGLISGSELRPFKIDWKGNYINIDPANLYSGGFDGQIIKNEKILLRQTGDRIFASHDHSGLYHLNNIHSFSTRKVKPELSLSSYKIDLHCLVGIMNSNFYLYLYRLKTREHGRALAQIDIETIEEMPLPAWNNELANQFNQISNLSSQLKELASESDNSIAQYKSMTAQLNELVYQCYGINQAETIYIEKNLGQSRSDSKQKKDVPATSLMK